MKKTILKLKRFIPSKIKQSYQNKIISRKINSLKPSNEYVLGTPEYLAACELEMGGYISNVKRRKLSPMDPRSSSQINKGGMTGGDKMIHHGYADKYSKHLGKFYDREEPLIIVECGILMGTGLALLSKLFPKSLIIGLDIDLSHTTDNLQNLKSRGAFEFSDPVLLEFDQFNPNLTELLKILGDRSIDIVIDDGYHSIETILNTFDTLKPHLSSEFVYFSEDNASVRHELKKKYPKSKVHNYGLLTVIENI